VLFRALDAEEAELLGLLASGATFGALCDVIAARNGADAAASRAAARLAARVDGELLVPGLA